MEVLDFGPATAQVFGLFDEVGYLRRAGVLPVERVWSSYPGLTMAWVLWEPAIEKLRGETGEPHLYEDHEHLYDQAVDYDRQRGSTGARPTKEELRQFVEETLQYIAVVQKPTMGDEALQSWVGRAG